MGGTDLLFCLEGIRPTGPGRFLRRAGFRTGDIVFSAFHCGKHDFVTGIVEVQIRVKGHSIGRACSRRSHLTRRLPGR